MKRHQFNVVVNTPREEPARRYIIQAIADILMDRINKLPEGRRFSAYQAVIRHFAKNDADSRDDPYRREIP